MNCSGRVEAEPEAIRRLEDEGWEAEKEEEGE